MLDWYDADVYLYYNKVFVETIIEIIKTCFWENCNEASSRRICLVSPCNKTQSIRSEERKLLYFCRKWI